MRVHVWLRALLKPRGPGVGHQQPHQQGRQHRVGRVVEEADGDEAEDERPRAPPEPEVLVQGVDDEDGEGQERVLQNVAFKPGTGGPSTPGPVKRCVRPPATSFSLLARPRPVAEWPDEPSRGPQRSLAMSIWLYRPLATLTVLALPAGLFAAPPTDWPGWRGSNRDALSPDKGLLTEWKAPGPPLAWKAA